LAKEEDHKTHHPQNISCVCIDPARDPRSTEKKDTGSEQQFLAIMDSERWCEVERPKTNTNPANLANLKQKEDCKRGPTNVK